MPIELVPDPLVAQEFHITFMTLWRWDRHPDRIALGWPPKIKIGTKNYRERSKLEAFKANLLQRALEREGALVRGGGGIGGGEPATP